jgi:hypothetical protein
MAPSGLAAQTPSAAIVFCAEPGLLEYKCACLVVSLRSHAAQWADLPLYAYSPRPGREVSPWLAALFHEYNVDLINAPLNTEFVHYPLANKPICMADAEQRLTADQLVFLDSDILCWGELADLALPEGIDLRLCRDGTKTVASSGPADPLEPFWQSLYELVDSSHQPYCETWLTGKRVRGWWISSVVVARRKAGLMARWLNCLRQAETACLVPPQASYLREQCTLCAVAAAAYDRFAELPLTHNYPIQCWKQFSARGYPPERAPLWHYQGFLNKAYRHFASQLDAQASIAAKITLIQGFIARLSSDYRRLLGLDESWFSSLRRRWMLGVRLRRLFGKSKASDASVLMAAGYDLE